MTSLAGAVDLAHLGAREDSDVSELVHQAWEMLPRGGTIVIPPGRFVARQPIKLFGRPFRLVGQALGDGRHGSQITFATDAAAGLQISRARGVQIADLTLRGPEMKPGSFLITFADGCAYVAIERCVIEGGANGLRVRRVNRLRIYASTLRNFSGRQVVLLNGAGERGRNHSVEFIGTTVCANHPGTDNVVQDGPGASTKFIACYIGMGRHGYWQRNTTGSSNDPNFLYVSSGGFEGGVGDCLRLECGQKAFLGGGAYFSSRGPGDGIALRGSFTSCTVSGCYIRGNGRHGIFHDSGLLAVSGSIIVNNGTEGRNRHRRAPVAVQDGGGQVLVVHPPARDWEPGDRVRVTPKDAPAFSIEIHPCSFPDRRSGFVCDRTIAMDSTIVRIGQGIRSTRQADAGVVSGTYIGTEKGGRNHQEFSILSDNPAFSTDLPKRTMTLLAEGILSPQFIEDGVWQISDVVAYVRPGKPAGAAQQQPGETAPTLTILLDGTTSLMAIALSDHPRRYRAPAAALLDARAAPLHLSVEVTPASQAPHTALDIHVQQIALA